MSSTAVPTSHPPLPARDRLDSASSRAPSKRDVAPRTSSAARARWVTASITLMLLGLNVAGAGYYLLPISERVRSPLHPLLKSSGAVGQAAGVIALAIFVFLWLYPLRKKWRRLAFTGSVGRWMEVHIIAALALPLLLTIHAAWRFTGVIGLGYWAMMIVCASGIIGRYLYVRIPRSRTGAELSLEEVAGQRRALLQQIVEVTGLTLDEVQTLIPANAARGAPTPARAIRMMLVNDLTRWRTTREIRRRWRALEGHTTKLERRTIDDVATLVAREMALAQQVALLNATHRIFRWWHVAHRPIALTALIAVIIHVAVVVAVGATWFW